MPSPTTTPKGGLKTEDDLNLSKKVPKKIIEATRNLQSLPSRKMRKKKKFSFGRLVTNPETVKVTRNHILKKGFLRGILLPFLILKVFRSYVAVQTYGEVGEIGIGGIVTRSMDN